MDLSVNEVHPEGEHEIEEKELELKDFSVATYGGKYHVQWEHDAKVTPLGQLPYFVQFLKMGGRFDQWVQDCPLTYLSPNAPSKLNVLGSLFLSVLSGHRRYAQVGALICDNISPGLLGMSKVVSEDSARRAIKKIDQTDSEKWLQGHLLENCLSLLDTPWIMDVDSSIKPLYGNQEMATVGYNPKKPGRPSHTLHTYFVAGLRLVLDVQVHAGNESNSTHTLPGMIELLNKLPQTHRPYWVRGDIGFGTDRVMTELESMGQAYLFKLKKSAKVQELIYKHHFSQKWKNLRDGWQVKNTEIKLQGWEQARQVTLIRRQFKPTSIVGIEHQTEQGQQLSLLDEDENQNLKSYQYSVLISNQQLDEHAAFDLYRDRADCENTFDELKNQWGWGGFTSQDIASCRTMTRIVALIYNWWTLFVHLASPHQHHEAITSRPLLLTGIARQVDHRNQKTLKLTTSDCKTKNFKRIYCHLNNLFDHVKRYAPQFNPKQCWHWFLKQIAEGYRRKIGEKNYLSLSSC